MIKISSDIKKIQPNFWNNCIFHPTDAVEDSWGKKILDRMARDKAIQTVRVYAMFEDIVYEDGDGNIAYDFRISDARLDYLVDMGYDILIAYGMLPKMLVTNADVTSSVSKGKTRYKGKMLYTGLPNNYQLWEEICYEYTKHICERYGIERVSKWHLHCYNEPDIRSFFLADISDDETPRRVNEYMKLYEGFIRGCTRYNENLRLGGPAIGGKTEFLDEFLKRVKENNLRLDYLSIHCYAGTRPDNADEIGFSTDNWFNKFDMQLDCVKKHGFEDTELVVDEWGMASCGFYNVEECPAFLERETELFSSYFVRLINRIIDRGLGITKLMVCLSGQHEMTTDFSGFRNFFTMNFFAKPIYNAYILAAKLYDGLLDYKCENENIYAVPTKNEKGDLALLLTYCTPKHERVLPEILEEVSFGDDLKGKKITVYCIDQTTTNPYTLYKKLGITEMTDEYIKILREEGNIKPISEFVYSDDSKISLKLTSNAVYLVLAEGE